jgi:hypothetical protein
MRVTNHNLSLSDDCNSVVIVVVGLLLLFADIWWMVRLNGMIARVSCFLNPEIFKDTGSFIYYLDILFVNAGCLRDAIIKKYINKIKSNITDEKQNQLTN